MSDAKWWMDVGSKWHQGLPPPDWSQAPDGRWHPPGADDTTDEMTVTSAGGGAHLPAAGRRASLWQAYRGWPPWARLAAPIVAFVLTVGVLAAAAAGGLLGDDPETSATDPETTATDETTPTTTVASASGGTGRSITTPTDATTTTASVPSTTIPPRHEPVPTTAPAPPPPTTTAPTDSDVHPGGRCSPDGATSISSDGIPLTCTTQKCRGAPFSEPRWRPTAC